MLNLLGVPGQKTQEARGTWFILPIETVDKASGQVIKRNALHFNCL